MKVFTIQVVGTKTALVEFDENNCRFDANEKPIAFPSREIAQKAIDNMDIRGLPLEIAEQEVQVAKKEQKQYYFMYYSTYRWDTGKEEIGCCVTSEHPISKTIALNEAKTGKLWVLRFWQKIPADKAEEFSKLQYSYQRTDNV